MSQGIASAVAEVTLEETLAHALGVESQSQIERHVELAAKCGPAAAEAGIEAALIIAKSSSRAEDFMLRVSKPVSDSTLEDLIAEFYREKGFEVRGLMIFNGDKRWGHVFVTNSSDHGRIMVTVNHRE